MANDVDIEKDNPVERREFERYSSNLPINIETADMPLGVVPVLIDVSMGGLSFQTSHKLRKSEIVWMEIPADSPLFETRGEVVWTKKEGELNHVGVMFLDMDENAKASLLKFLKYVKKGGMF